MMNRPKSESSDGHQSNLSPDTASKPASSIMQSRFAVLAMIFGVTGCLGIPLLWLNHNFSNAERLFWSAVSLFYTFMLLWGTYLICAWAYQRIAG